MIEKTCRFLSKYKQRSLTWSRGADGLSEEVTPKRRMERWVGVSQVEVSWGRGGESWQREPSVKAGAWQGEAEASPAQREPRPWDGGQRQARGVGRPQTTKGQVMPGNTAFIPWIRGAHGRGFRRGVVCHAQVLELHSGCFQNGMLQINGR